MPSSAPSLSICFNEAEAFTPRIQAVAPQRPVGVQASMRPRLLHLGYNTYTIHADYDRQRFNEAEAFTPRIPGSSASRSRRFIYASMRPRLLHLGYRGFLDAGAIRDRASMRPRLLHLGYLRHDQGDRWRRSRFNEAEAFTPRIRTLRLSHPTCRRMLQ